MASITDSSAVDSLRRFQFTDSPQPPTGLYLFFSFDLVNSTRLKTAYPSKWPLIVTKFYDLVRSALDTRLTGTVPWKFVGDEVLFYKQLTSREELSTVLGKTHAAMMSAISGLHRLFEDTESIISIKSAVWLASAQMVQPKSLDNLDSIGLGHRNIILRTADGFDFLGPDVDIGFRMMKHLERARMIVSANLAWLLYKFRSEWEDPVEEQLRIVSLNPLKGVWDGRPYPIIWFEKSWNTVRDSFTYDEHLSSEIIADLKHSPDELLDISRIEKIFKDIGRINEMTAIAELLDDLPNTNLPDDAIYVVPESKKAEVHCVAICFDTTGRIMIARRPSSKKRLPDCWEFGCAQLKLGKRFEDCLTERYFEDFGAKLVFGTQLAPIAIFYVDDQEEQRSIPGIIFVATATNADEVERHYSREKHPDVQWLQGHWSVPCKCLIESRLAFSLDKVPRKCDVMVA